MSTEESQGAREVRVGQVCWLEIPVSDISRASKFYEGLFGWQCDLNPVPQAETPTPDCPFKGMYFFNKKDTVNGAFVVMSDDHRVVNFFEDRPRAMPVLPTIQVADIAETLKLAEKLGGKNQWPRTSCGPNAGFYAHVIDTEGNMIGMWAQN
ncbi:unnamed protein product [Clonostachys solani]|uniref:Glyoxalase/Bleomycin resistance-like N-terminal domain-containing protein n=1 Tax=Clonostachys solani TaxID=160281 RepID=A0A9N9ZP96_9HYPO|nr:unnamed protein product [Clonostachys solani]